MVGLGFAAIGGAILSILLLIAYGFWSMDRIAHQGQIGRRSWWRR